MRSKFKDTGPIPITQIMLDIANFRIGEADDQSDCIELLFSAFGPKMVHIAEHISRHGLSPKPIVVKKGANDSWIVKDGNRRIAAIQLLNNPALAPEKYKNTFTKLKDELYKTGNIPTVVSCITSDDDSVIFDYMQLEHLGEQDGAGQVDWGTREKDNLALAMGGKPSSAIARKVCEYLQGHGLEEAKSVKITNIQRLLQDQYVQGQLGIVWDGENVTFALNEEDTKKALVEIVLDFANREVKVSAIYDRADRKKYIDDLLDTRGFRPSSAPTPQPGTATAPGAPAPGAATPPPPVATAAKATPIPAKAPRERKHLIDRRRGGLNVPIGETKLRSIINELSRHIPVQEAPIAAGVLFRLVVEMSVKHYAQANGLRTNGELKKMIHSAATHMKAAGLIDQKQFEVLEKMSKADELFSANTLNHYVHSPTFMPTGTELCTFWDNIYFFLNKCW